jgi:hypothetical protein
MKIIFSRKGFDSGYGRVASPIFGNNEMFSLPIPSQQGTRYADLRTCSGRPVGKIARDLTSDFRNQDWCLDSSSRAHLDPDLSHRYYCRAANWRPLFGQCNAAQGHLEKQKVQAGDIFIFFGWFRRVHEEQGRWAYVKDGTEESRQGIHSIFGWLQIQAVKNIKDTRGSLPDWSRDHHHVKYFTNKNSPRNNTLYIASEKLRLGNESFEAPGGGAFRSFFDELQLTRRNQQNKYSRCVWEMPGWLHPSRRKSVLSYHSNMDRWTKSGSKTILRAASRGQEFVLDAEHYPEAIPWLKNLFEMGLRNKSISPDLRPSITGI